jgi:steroid delta-isomerase-like uncharacterized protein
MADNKPLVENFFDKVINGGDVDAIDELLADDFVEHEQIPGIPEGREGTKAFFGMTREAFPDLSATIDLMVEEGDKVAVRSTWKATHEGEFLGVPATGNKVEFTNLDIVAFNADGLCAEHWGLADMLTVMQQIGAVPAPAAS